MMRFALVFAVAILFQSVLCPPARGGGLEGFGPIYDHFALTLQEGERTEVLGPLFSHEQEGTREQWVVAPLFSEVHDASTDFTEYDVLYPLITYDRFGLEYRWQFMQLFSFSGGQTMDQQGKHRTSFFPFYFRQKSADPDLNYTAVVPFYGHLKNRFFRDEIFFVMLPAYVQTRKRDVVTDNYLAPFFHSRHGDGLRGWQFWPLVGHEHKDLTTRTNQYDEVETIGGREKWFVLWPFFIHNDLGLGTTNLQTQHLFLPFYAAQHSPLRDSTSYLWPLGYTYTEDREKKYREWMAPWPFIDFARGEGKTLNRVWPLFSRGKTPTLESDSYLWPLLKYTHIKSDPLDRTRFRVLFYLYCDVIEKNLAAGTTAERTDLWPLFTARRDHNGNERLQLFAPVEPVIPSNAAIERNYSPLWSIWISEKNPKAGTRSQSFLSNLYRHEVAPKTRKCSLLFGLFRYESRPEGKRWRLFYIPWETKSTSSGA